jgi:hypothetical protein
LLGGGAWLDIFGCVWLIVYRWFKRGNGQWSYIIIEQRGERELPASRHQINNIGSTFEKVFKGAISHESCTYSSFPIQRAQVGVAIFEKILIPMLIMKVSFRQIWEVVHCPFLDAEGPILGQKSPS